MDVMGDKEETKGVVENHLFSFEMRRIMFSMPLMILAVGAASIMSTN